MTLGQWRQTDSPKLYFFLRYMNVLYVRCKAHCLVICSFWSSDLHCALFSPAQVLISLVGDSLTHTVTKADGCTAVCFSSLFNSFTLANCAGSSLCLQTCFTFPTLHEHVVYLRATKFAVSTHTGPQQGQAVHTEHTDVIFLYLYSEWPSPTYPGLLLGPDGDDLILSDSLCFPVDQ